MPSTDPTGDPHAVAFALTGRQRRFLSEALTAGREGLLSDLAEHADRLNDPERSRQRVDAYTRLLAGLHFGSLTPPPKLRSLAIEDARVIDEANEFERVVFEHEAFSALLTQLALTSEEQC